MALAAVLGAVLVDSTTGSAVMSALRGAAGSPPTTVVSVLPGVPSVVSVLPAEEVGGAEALSTVPAPELADIFASLTASTPVFKISRKTR